MCFLQISGKGDIFKKYNISIQYIFSLVILTNSLTILVTIGDEQGERFHQDLKFMEDRYKGRWDISILADYCWSIKRGEPLKTHRRVSEKRRFMALCKH